MEREKERNGGRGEGERGEGEREGEEKEGRRGKMIRAVFFFSFPFLPSTAYSGSTISLVVLELPLNRSLSLSVLDSLMSA